MGYNRYRKKSRLTLLFSLLLTALYAQPTGNSKISGTVTDEATGQPVEYATIALNHPATGKPVNGTVADDKGKFVIKGIANGKYVVAISFIGFETVSRDVTIADKNLELGNIALQPSVKVLSEITVEGQRSLIEDKVDRLVYNAENDATTQGGDAADVLRRVPMLSVDLDGNVSLRGSENIRVLINNRPSTIMASGIADALKQIPADEIKSVEVITSPSARYDAEGTAGIINIITKKNVLQGATLNINSSAGIRGSNLGLNGGYKKGKLGLSLGGFGRSSYNVDGSFENRQITTGLDGNQLLSTQEANTRSNSLNGNYTLGMDYDINKKNFISSSVRFGVRDQNDFQDGLLSQSFQNGTLLGTNLRNVDTENNSNTVDVNFNYTRSFDKPQHEFSLLGQYSKNSRNNDFINTELDLNDLSILNRIKNENESSDREVTIQADYQVPVGDNQMLEIGGKQIMRTVLSDFQLSTAVGEGPFVPSTEQTLTNIFNYEQNITAGYLSYTLNFLERYSVKAGGRYEYTTIDAFFQDEQDIDIPSYGVFVPSVNISKKLKNNNTLKASFNRRIQRPSIRFLNPNIQGANQLNVTVGNPSLDPEFTNNYELSYSTFIKGTTLTFSSYIRTTSEALQAVRDVTGQDTIRTTFQNIGTENAYGGSLFANVNINNKLTLSGGSEIYYLTLKNNVTNPLFSADNAGWVASLRMFGSYKLSDQWSLQLFSFYRGRRVELQGFRGGFGVYSLSVQKSLPNKKGSFGIGAENFFTPKFRINNETVSPVIDQFSTDVSRRANIKATLNLRLGKLENQNTSRRRKRSINNDDLKDGGDNQDAEGQGGNGPGTSQSRPQQRPAKGGKEKTKN